MKIEIRKIGNSEGTLGWLCQQALSVEVYITKCGDTLAKVQIGNHSQYYYDCHSQLECRHEDNIWLTDASKKILNKACRQAYLDWVDERESEAPESYTITLSKQDDN